MKELTKAKRKIAIVALIVVLICMTVITFQI